MLITYIKGGTPAQIFFGEGVCNDEGYICYILTEDEVGKLEDLWKSLRGTTDDDGHQVMAIAHMAPLDQVS
jgi:hypothetical protein